jgi:hypothetical protein
VFCSSQDLVNKQCALPTELHPNNHSHLKSSVNETGPGLSCRNVVCESDRLDSRRDNAHKLQACGLRSRFQMSQGCVQPFVSIR